MGAYQELPPSPALTEHLACLWYQSVDPDEPPREVRVLPDACIDIVWPADGAPLVAGPDTRSWISTLAPGTLIVGARFRPGRAPDLLRLSARELVDAAPPLAAVWGDAPVRRLRESDAPGSAPTMLERVEAELVARRSASPAWLPSVLDWVRTTRFGAPSAELSISDRQLRRRVEDRLGYGPRMARRVLRLQRMLTLATGGRRLLADLALAAGYADQAHMTRECRELAGLSPARLLALWFPSSR